MDISHPNVEEAADPIRVSGRLQSDRGLVVGRPTARIDDDPGTGEGDVNRPAEEDNFADSDRTVLTNCGAVP